MARIISLGTAIPSYRLTQVDAVAAIAHSLKLGSGRAAALEEIFRRSEVDTRYCVLDPKSLQQPRSLSDTMTLYREHAEQLSLDAARSCLTDANVRPEQVDLIITCSCTGMLLPSLSLLIAHDLGLRSSVRRMPITEAGCSGGAYALARARDYVRAFPTARVLVIAVELPSLTLQKNDQSNSNVVACALFGDGAAAALIEGQQVESPLRSTVLEIVDTHTEVFPNSLGDLGFDLRDGGLHIVLSHLVPQIVSENAPLTIKKFLAQSGLKKDDLSFFVLHPGGRKILDELASCLELSDKSTEISRQILRRYGNQSSASVLFVLKQTLRDNSAEGYGLLAAFGPGITMELSLLHRGSHSTMTLPEEQELAS